MTKRWIPLCVPGRDDGPGDWFAFDRLAAEENRERCVECADRLAAVRECRLRNVDPQTGEVR